MSTPPAPSLWTRWKSLRLPWRRHVLIGSDLSGATFWEYHPSGVSRAARPRRIMRAPKHTHHSDVQVSPQWHQWLKQTRMEAPSLAEQVMDLRRVQELKVNAKLADERWESKGRYIGMPKTEVEVTSQRNGVGGVDDVKVSKGREGVKTAVDAQVPEANDDPWKKADETGHNPVGKWQPEAWSPGPKRK